MWSLFSTTRSTQNWTFHILADSISFDTSNNAIEDTCAPAIAQRSFHKRKARMKRYRVDGQPSYAQVSKRLTTFFQIEKSRPIVLKLPFPATLLFVLSSKCRSSLSLVQSISATRTSPSSPPHSHIVSWTVLAS
ncbi:hypothetical protein M408DRAFT_180098 [Serendipita vermifera MAFF 305830]|uniref:Uncharacterized protein n=1 Tax=Serendipita vermifera MAFF 305830 TaxID=933852 RepID=A0A0C2XC51_SERVB|nr:hypothetical protein M408DRAFT_180098 [Serendipita vermifera MAFF 305830]